MKISEEQLRELARAAQIELTDAEVTDFARDIEALFALADALYEVPCVTAKRASDVAPVPMDALRADEAGSCMPRELLLRAAPCQRDGYIVVPRAVEE